MITFMILMCVGGFNIGYAIPSANGLSDLFNAKYHWDTEKEQTVHQSIIGSVIVLG